MPALLERLDISGYMITADAMSCQQAIAEKITRKAADDVLGLKDSHPLFHREVRAYCSAALAEPKNYPVCSVH